jgi:hypothetical protein
MDLSRDRQIEEEDLTIILFVLFKFCQEDQRKCKVHILWEMKKKGISLYRSLLISHMQMISFAD